MDIRPLRVRLDLAKVNVPSYRRYVWYPVSPCALSTIGDLKENICKKFNLSLGEVLLFVDGGLMQDEDTVLLLRENDVVQIVYTSEYQDNVQPVYEDFMDIMPPGTMSDASFLRRTQNLNDVSTPERKKKKKKRKRKHDELDESEQGAHRDVDEAVNINGPSASCSLTLSTPVKIHDNQDELIVPLSEVLNSSVDSKTIYSMEKAKPLDFNTVQHVSEQSSHFVPPECIIQNTNLDSKVKSKNSAKVTPKDRDESTYADVSTMSLAAENDTKVPLNEFKSTNCKKRKRKRKRRRAKDISFDACGDSSISYPQTNSQHIKFTDAERRMENLATDCTKSNASLLSTTAGGSASEDTDSVAEGSMPVRSPKTLNGKKDLTLQAMTFHLQTTGIQRLYDSLSLLENHKERKAASTSPVLTMHNYHTQVSTLPCSPSGSSQIAFKVSTPNPVSMKFDHTASPTFSGPSPGGSQVPIKGSTPKSVSLKSDHTALPSCSGPSPGGSQVQIKAANTNPLPATIDHAALPTLSGPPPVGSRIAFKLLELSDMYCPEVSDFKEGTVVAVDPESEDIVIQLTNPETKQPREGKFENIYEEETEEQPKCQIIQQIAVKWPDLIEPKLIQV